MSDTKKPFNEEDGTDPLTLHNLINAHDMRKEGFNWIKPQQGGQGKSVEQIYVDGIVDAGREGDFLTEPPKKEHVQEASSELGQEANNNNPEIRSTDPEFNPCPTFLQGICRIDGRPCAYSIVDYKECGKYYLALSGNPDLFELPLGRENSQEYQQGIKA